MPYKVRKLKYMNLRTDEQYPASGRGADVGDRQGAASR